MRWKEAPNISWTSLIGSSPGHMQSGRQSHINQKSKEAWFYEHLPVPTSIDWFFIDENLLLNGAFVMLVLQYCNFLWIFYVRNILIGVLMYTKYAHGQLRLSEKRKHLFSETCASSLTHKAKLKITVCPYVYTVCYVYLLILIEWQASLPFTDR